MTIVDFPKEGSIGTSLKPKRYDIELYQGDSFDVSISFKQTDGTPVDLTGTEIKAKIVAADGGTAPASQFDSTGSNLAGGVVRLVIDDTSAFSGSYNWDLQLKQGTKQRTYIGGIVTVTGDITPDA